MLSGNVLRASVVAVAATIVLVAAILTVGDLSAGLRRADIGFASLWLSAAFALGLWQDRRLLGSGSPVRGIVSAVALVPAVFVLLLAVGGYAPAAAVAVWLSVFAVLNVSMQQAAWTRPVALAAWVAGVFALCTLRGRVDAFNAGVAEQTLWLSSVLLDASVVPHLRDGRTLDLIVGEVVPAARIALWDGVLPMLALSSLSIVYWRRSLVQAVLAGVAVAATWIAVQAVGTWLVVPDVEAAAAAIAAGGGSTIVGSDLATLLCSLATVAAAAATALCVGHLTDPIPVPQPDWNQPVATYFWNLFMRFPASLSPDPAA